MSKVVKEEIGPLTEKVTLTIERADFEPVFLKELNKLRTTGNFKGFRKGKVPLDFLKRMYGQGLLSEVVNNVFQQEVEKTFESGYIGGPIPVEGQQMVAPDPKKLEDIVFSFEAGREPAFEIQGLDADTEYEVFKLQVPAEKVAERLEDLRKRRGSYEDREGNITEGDLLSIEAVELDENNQVMENGWKTTFSILVERIQEGPVKSELLTKKKEDTFQFNIFQLEQDASPRMVKKYLLNYSDENLESDVTTGEMFQGTVKEVKSMVPAEMTPEFFMETFGDDVDSQEKAIERLTKISESEFEGGIDSLFLESFRNKLMDMNREAMPLPEDFLKRWLTYSNTRNADRLIENFDMYADSVRWSILYNKIVQQFDISITDQDIRGKAYQKAISTFGNYLNDASLLTRVMDYYVKDPKMRRELIEEVLTDQVLDRVKGTVKLVEVPVSDTALIEKLEELKKSVESKNAVLASAQEDHDHDHDHDHE